MKDTSWVNQKFMKKRGNNLGLKQNINPCLGSVRAKKRKKRTDDQGKMNI